MVFPKTIVNEGLNPPDVRYYVCNVVGRYKCIVAAKYEDIGFHVGWLEAGWCEGRVEVVNV